MFDFIYAVNAGKVNIKHHITLWIYLIYFLGVSVYFDIILHEITLKSDIC